MFRKEFKERAKVLGYKLTDVAREFGIGVNGVHRWEVVPRYAEYWLYWKEGEDRDYGELVARLEGFVEGLR